MKVAEESNPEVDATKILLSRIRSAGLLDVSLNTFDGLRNRADFPRPVEVGKTLKYRRKDLERWAENLRPARNAKRPPVGRKPEAQ